VWYCDCGRAYHIHVERTHEDAELPAAPPALSPGQVRVSKFERQVLSCVAVGMTDREVAAHLGASTNQIRYAMRDAITRLAARSRTEAVAVALTAGLIELSRAISF
jgi:DNA-binding NarL/FixJ family response regulator